jgi:hypothetical protein
MILGFTEHVWANKTKFFELGGRGSGVKAKSSQVPKMFPKEFPIAPHFYPICFDKCCPFFTLGQRGGILYFKIKCSILRSFHHFIYLK